MIAMKLALPLSSERDVAEAVTGEPAAIEGIAAVQDDTGFHFVGERIPVQFPVLLPFGDQDQGVSLFGNLLGAGATDCAHIAVQFLEALHGDWIVYANLAAAVDQLAGDIDGGRLADRKS